FHVHFSLFSFPYCHLYSLFFYSVPATLVFYILSYTTLFRSLCTALRFGFCQYIFRFGAPFFIVAHHDPAFPAAVFSQVEAAVAPDRKSTRLNSSHVSSSYAVFCLKNNTSRNETMTPT